MTSPTRTERATNLRHTPKCPKIISQAGDFASWRIDSRPAFPLPAPLAMTIALAYNPPEMAGAQRHGPRSSRPFSVTLVTWGVFILGLANAWRALALYRQSDLLLELGVSLDPRLRLFLALIWAAVFVILAISLWRRWATARFLAPALILFYSVYELGISSLFALSAETLSGLPANLAMASVAVAFSAWSLNRKAARQYFQVSR
jgi:hypothetical protein